MTINCPSEQSKLLAALPHFLYALLDMDLVMAASGFPPPNMDQEHRSSDEGNVHS
jgi:hypothetical protein